MNKMLFFACTDLLIALAIYDTSAPDHPNNVGVRFLSGYSSVSHEEPSRSCVFVSDCVLFCVIVLSVRVEFDQCTFVLIDKPTFHCFVVRFYTFVNERRSYRVDFTCRRNKILQSTNSQATQFCRQHSGPPSRIPKPATYG
ncbi:hypothetical protein T10_2668 [Trichinella papuae]|uniref:Secreted protein n=1 Tax=Trichinella papuae TaxID=268474 RepID=A0A0V1N7C9_9BILA|nr:hypothetical protein T10_2668 [Trichinella papuae]